jgi:hypothetical protein
LSIAAAATEGDSKKLAALSRQLAELMAATTLASKSKIVPAPPVEELFKTVGQENRIALAPERLNSHIGGGALPGHHIHVFGRPDSGKSAFVINAAVVLASRGYRVTVVGTEDQIAISKSRAVCRATSMTWQEVEADRERAIALYRERGIEDNLRMVQLINGSVESLRPDIELFQPHVIVLDQIRSLGGQGDGLTARLEENAVAFRSCLLEYNLLGFSVSQAWGGAEGKAILDMNDIDSSKTGLPGTADLICGLGVTPEMKVRNERMLSLPKSKLAVDGGETILLTIDRARSKFV